MSSTTKTQIIVFGLAILTSVGISSILPILPSFATSLNLSPHAVSAIIAVYALPGFFLTPVYGFIADRFGRKAVLVPSLFFFLLGGIGSFFSSSFTTLIFFRVFQGIGAGAFGLIYATIVADTWTGSERIKMMGRAGMALGMGTGLSPALGGVLGSFGWRYVFLLSLLALPVLYLCSKVELYKPVSQHDQSIKDASKSYYHVVVELITLSGSLPLLLLTFCAFMILSGPVITCFPLIAAQAFNASPVAIGIIMSLASLASAIPASNLSSLCKRFSTKFLLLCGLIAYALFLCGLALCALKDINIPLLLLPLSLLLFGLAQGLTIPLSTSLLSCQTDEKKRASLMSLNSMSMRLAQAIGSVLFGFIVTQTTLSISCLTALVPIIAMAFLLTKIPLAAVYQHK